MQLKQELHNVSMGSQTLAQYLTQIKTIVDNLAAAEVHIDTEDIILYTLNGLPPSFQTFKTLIRNQLTATHLINLLPSSTSTNKSPYQNLHKDPPDYTHLRVFGCACYPLFPSPNRHKLQPRTTQCVLIGYPSNIKGYKCLHISSGRVYISRHVIFDENTFPYKQLSTSTPSPSVPTELHSTPPLLLTPSSSSNSTPTNPEFSVLPLQSVSQPQQASPHITTPPLSSTSALPPTISQLAPLQHPYQYTPW